MNVTKPIMIGLWRFILFVLLFQRSFSLKFAFRRDWKSLLSYHSLNPIRGLSSSVKYCGEYFTEYEENDNKVSLTYVFYAKTAEKPKSFLRRQIPTQILVNVTGNTVDELLNLHYEETNSVIEWGDLVQYSVDSISVLFHSQEELSHYQCQLSTPLQQLVSVNHLQCSEENIQFLKSRVGEVDNVPMIFSETSVTVLTFNHSLVLNSVSRSGCSDDLLSVFGVLLTFVLIVAFIFLMIFAYSNKKKSKYIGNGIDVNDIKHISKPFSSGINPYSKKLDIVTDVPPTEPKVTTVEIPTITI
ncbi:hypothetical protein WA171_003176, partial [Blastocystis sp. BT1]